MWRSTDIHADTQYKAYRLYYPSHKISDISNQIKLQNPKEEQQEEETLETVVGGPGVKNRYQTLWDN